MTTSDTGPNRRTARSKIPALAGVTALALLATVVQIGRSPLAEEQTNSAPSTPKSQPAGPETIHLILQPAPKPRPALKYLLMPARPERQSSNAAVDYLALIDTLPQKAADERDRIQKGLNQPLDEIDREALIPGWPAAWVERKFTRATRATHCDWQLPVQEGPKLVLPSLGALRRLANWQAVHARALLAEGKLEEALQALRNGVAMGMHVGQDLTLIQGLVGVAIHSVMIERIERDWVQQPGAPNLYWALTTLPRPMIDFVSVAQWERSWVEGALPETIRAKIRAQPLTAQEVGRLYDALAEMLLPLDPEGDFKIDVADYREAPPGLRNWLVEAGYEAELVASMPGEQVHALYLIDSHRELVDDQIKWFAVPYSQSAGRYGTAVDNAVESRKAHKLIEAIVPALERANLLAARLERNVDRLRVVEAIRMYAAEHGGALPPSLEEITAVPVPDDPLTGKPFAYTVDGDTATLAPAEPGPEPYDNRVYKLTIAR